MSNVSWYVVFMLLYILMQHSDQFPIKEQHTLDMVSIIVKGKWLISLRLEA